MGLLEPRLPDYPLDEWRALPYTDRLRVQCGTWTTQGFGSPLTVYLMYLVKAVLFIVGWALFVTSAEPAWTLGNIGSWWNELIAFQKAVLWAMLFEGLGFGCGSGPLTGRYVPPFVAFTHFLRPGTTRLAPWPSRNPLAMGTRRTIIDVALYVGIMGTLVRALLADVVLADELFVPIMVLVPLLGLRDKAAFLIFRSEHYLLTVAVFVLGDGVGGIFAAAAMIQLAIWWGAATSKLNHHFPSVVAVMISNAPLVPAPLKRRMFVAAPDDMRPSKLAAAIAHGGTVIEYLFPVILVTSTGGTTVKVALAVMLAFHLFIMSSVALGVPTEWNVFFLYSMFVLFGSQDGVPIGRLADDPLLVAMLVVALLGFPILGNLRPDLVSFLPAMRYYAGNWATSQWLFRKGSFERLDDHIVKTSSTTRGQLGYFYDEDTTEFLVGKVAAFRAMHLHGRLYAALGSSAVDDLDAYDVIDGELVAGLVLGWNFGEGHLHNEELLAAVQSRCGFAPGDLRCIMVEAQPMGKPSWSWRIVDAATGEVARGRANVADFLDRQPWQSDDADHSIVGATAGAER